MTCSNMSCPVLDNTGAEKLDFCKPPCPSHPSYHSLLLYWPGWTLFFFLFLYGLCSLLIPALVIEGEKISMFSYLIKKECKLFFTNVVIHLWNAVCSLQQSCVAIAMLFANTSHIYCVKRVKCMKKYDRRELCWCEIKRVWVLDMCWQVDSLVRVALLHQGWAVSTQCASLQTPWGTMRTSSLLRPRVNTCSRCPSWPDDPRQCSHVSVITIHQPSVKKQYARRAAGV